MIIHDEEFKEIDNILDFLEELIFQNGLVYATRLNNDDDEWIFAVYHDYVYFCITKITRSLRASLEIIRNKYREDSFSIYRTIYETYLHLSNAINNPKYIDKAVFKTLGLRLGRYQFYRYRGRTNRNKLYNPETKEVLDYDIRTTTLSKNTINSADIEIHPYIYKFTSELIHSNFISSGNYRSEDDLYYEVRDIKLNVDTIFFMYYFIYILLEQIECFGEKFKKYEDVNFSQITVDELSDLCGFKKLVKDKLLLLLNYLEFPNEFEGFDDVIKKRLT